MKPYYGTVYKVQREHSPENIERYLRDMQAAGLNIVVIWPSVYWWEDRTQPGYPYNTGRMILRLAESLGMKIIMETAGQLTALEYAPDFVVKDEYYPIGKDGLRENRGNDYGYLNYFHPEVASLVAKQLQEIAIAYRDFPALYGYDIFNETMFESYDKYTLERFRNWLKEKYQDICNLNAIWDRVYYDWSQIQFTPWTWASVMPYVDLLEFKRDAIGIQLGQWRDILRQYDPSHPTIADNLYSMLAPDHSSFRNTDEWVTDANVDELGISFYPKNGVPAIMPHKRWEMLCGYTSASKDRAFWVSELQTHNQSAFRPNTAVSVRELRAWTWECFAAGCRGVIYWKWHPFIKGIQSTGRGLVDYKGRFTERTWEVRKIADQLAAGKSAIAATMPEIPKAAILYDRLNFSFTKAYSHSYSIVPQAFYLDALEGVYRCLWDAHIPACFIRPEDVISGAVSRYATLFISAQLVLSDALAQAIKAYAEAGGTVIIDGKFGFIDEKGVMMNAIPGGPVLQPLLGVDWSDIDSEGHGITYAWDGEQDAMEGSYERQLLHVLEGERRQVIGTFQDGFPALVRAKVGKGELLYTPTALWYGYGKTAAPQTAGFMERIIGHCSLRTYGYDGQAIINVNRSADGRTLVLYAFQYGENADQGLFTTTIPEGTYQVANLMDGTVQTIVCADSQVSIPLAIGGNDVAVYTIEPTVPKK